MQTGRTEASVIQIASSVVPMHRNTTHSELTLCFSVNMTDRVGAAGCCVDDACSHQSFNLSLSVLPAESLFPPGTSCHTHTVLLFCPPSSFAAHYKKKKKTCLCTKLSQDVLQGMREREERWGWKTKERRRIEEWTGETDKWRCHDSRCAVIDVSLASRLALAPARVNYSHKRG